MDRRYTKQRHSRVSKFEFEKKQNELAKQEKELSKLDLEIKQLKLPWYKKPSYLTPFIAIVTILASIFSGYLDINNLNSRHKKTIDSLEKKFSTDTILLNEKIRELNEIKSKYISEDQIRLYSRFLQDEFIVEVDELTIDQKGDSVILDSTHEFQISIDAASNNQFKEFSMYELLTFSLSANSLNDTRDLQIDEIELLFFVVPYEIDKIGNADSLFTASFTGWETIEFQLNSQEGYYWTESFWSDQLAPSIKSAYYHEKHVSVCLGIGLDFNSPFIQRTDVKFFQILGVEIRPSI